LDYQQRGGGHLPPLASACYFSAMSVTRRSRWLLQGSIIVLVAVFVLLWFALRPQSAVTLTVMDVGQGDAILLHTSSGEDMMIDGGPNERVLAALGKALPLTDRSIELMVLTHPHADHYAGLMAVLDRYSVDRVVTSDTSSEGTYFLRWKKKAITKEYGTVKAGDRFQLGPASVTVLWPAAGYANKDVNEMSVVLRVDVGHSCALLMGDVGFPVEKELLLRQERLRCDVLKVGHHGSAQASSDTFLQAVQPKWGVISVGERNRYGHPAAAALSRLQASGAALWRTDQDGAFRWLCSAEGECRVED
jgi:competence protein ComEC